MVKLKYFGTDGVRGTAGEFPMTEEFALAMGKAAGELLCGPAPQNGLFVVGRDTRHSGPSLQRALMEGLVYNGAKVIDLGIITTPGIAYLVHKLGATGGAVVSASHNPASENGIKLLNGDGMKLSEQDEAAIEALIDKIMVCPVFPPPIPGEVVEGGTYYQDYLKDLLQTWPNLNLKGLVALVDCANGAAWRAAPEALRSLGATVILLNDDPNGVINANAGSEFVRSDPSRFAELITSHHADLGITFDGDADRVILMDESGHLVDGDHMLAILADWLHSQGRLLGNSLVTTIMANGALAGFSQTRGFDLIETPVGDKYITEKLVELSLKYPPDNQLGVGGEQSGHIILLDEDHRTGDGIRTALFLLGVLRSQPGMPLSTLISKIQKYPQLVTSCFVASKPELATLGLLNEELARLGQHLPGLVRYNVRYSGTEPKFRIMIETDTRHTPEQVASLAWKICDLVQRETGTEIGERTEVLNVSEGGLMPRPQE